MTANHHLTAGISDSHTIKHGELFFLMDRRGEVPFTTGHGLGLYLHDMRFLSGYAIRYAGTAFEGLGVISDQGDRACLELGNPPLALPDGTELDKLQLGARYDRRIDGEALTMTDRLCLTNYTDRPLTLPVELSFEAQFRDMFQVRGLFPEQQGELKPPRWEKNELVFSYIGLDGVDRSTRISFSRRPDHKKVAGCEFTLQIPPGGTSELTVVMEAREDGDECLHTPFSQRERLSYAEISSDSFLLNSVVDRCFADLRLLLNRREAHAYYAAGIPWFAVVFGRDSLLTAMMTLPFNNSIAESTLRLLGELQGRRHNPENEEEPGRILHELRCGELARGGKLAKSPDYGTVDATPLFLMLFSEHAAWTGSLELFCELRESVELALQWIDDRMERFDGWLAYKCVSEDACNHQGWKDVDGGIARSDGSPALAPIALVELQGMVYAAWLGCAELFRRLGEKDRAEELERRARSLRKRFSESFWQSDGDYLALALEGQDFEPVRVVTSNMGQALWTGIVEAEHSRAVARHLLDKDSFSGWGIRTLSAREKAYCPIGYHTGGVWPHDNALAAAGLKRYGHDQEAERLIDGLLRAAFHFPLRRLPELFCGFSRQTHTVPIAYPTACSPQAWAAASIPSMLATLLGLEADAFEQRLILRRPSLPPSVANLKLRDLMVGSASVDLTFHRAGSQTEVVIDGVRGECEISVED